MHNSLKRVRGLNFCWWGAQGLRQHTARWKYRRGFVCPEGMAGWGRVGTNGNGTGLYSETQLYMRDLYQFLQLVLKQGRVVLGDFMAVEGVFVFIAVLMCALSTDFILFMMMVCMRQGHVYHQK